MTKTAIVVFTYPNDFPKAARMTYHLKDIFDDIFFCIETKHSDVPLPSWVKPLVVDFNRGPSLFGAEAVIGMRQVYTNLSKEYDYVMKLDSDTVLFRPDIYLNHIKTESDFIFIRRFLDEYHPYACNGCCYMMSRKAIEEINKIDSTRFSNMISECGLHEDLIFSKAFSSVEIVKAEISKAKVWMAAKQYKEKDCIVGHFGYSDLMRIEDEVNNINPELAKVMFHTPEITEYIHKVLFYCTDKGIKVGQAKDYFNPDGGPTAYYADIEKLQKAQLAKQAQQANNAKR